MLSINLSWCVTWVGVGSVRIIIARVSALLYRAVVSLYKHLINTV
jgi:hypothetical protein